MRVFRERTQRPSSSPALPTVGIAPQRRRLSDIRLAPARASPGAAVALLIIGGAVGAVMASSAAPFPPARFR
jgi:hypothetical protein